MVYTNPVRGVSYEHFLRSVTPTVIRRCRTRCLLDQSENGESLSVATHVYVTSSVHFDSGQSAKPTLPLFNTRRGLDVKAPENSVRETRAYDLPSATARTRPLRIRSEEVSWVYYVLQRRYIFADHSRDVQFAGVTVKVMSKYEYRWNT